VAQRKAITLPLERKMTKEEQEAVNHFFLKITDHPNKLILKPKKAGQERDIMVSVKDIVAEWKILLEELGESAPKAPESVTQNG
jgi:hypothetical protein